MLRSRRDNGSLSRSKRCDCGTEDVVSISTGRWAYKIGGQPRSLRGMETASTCGGGAPLENVKVNE